MSHIKLHSNKAGSHFTYNPKLFRLLLSLFVGIIFVSIPLAESGSSESVTAESSSESAPWSLSEEETKSKPKDDDFDVYEFNEDSNADFVPNNGAEIDADAGAGEQETVLIGGEKGTDKKTVKSHDAVKTGLPCHFCTMSLKRLSKVALDVYNSRVAKISDFQTAALDLINLYRFNHGAKALVLDPILNKQAQLWANTLAKSNTLDYSCKYGTIINSSKCNYTESIALVEPNENPSAAAKAAIQKWYKEGIQFGYKYGELSPPKPLAKNVADFTAMLWKKTLKVGFGLAEDKNGEIIFVARYIPAGNIPGQYGKNVLP